MVPRRVPLPLAATRLETREPRHEDGPRHAPTLRGNIAGLPRDSPPFGVLSPSVPATSAFGLAVFRRHRSVVVPSRGRLPGGFPLARSSSGPCNPLRGFRALGSSLAGRPTRCSSLLRGALTFPGGTLPLARRGADETTGRSRRLTERGLFPKELATPGHRGPWYPLRGSGSRCTARSRPFTRKARAPAAPPRSTFVSESHPGRHPLGPAPPLREEHSREHRPHLMVVGPRSTPEGVSFRPSTGTNR